MLKQKVAQVFQKLTKKSPNQFDLKAILFTTTQKVTNHLGYFEIKCAAKKSQNLVTLATTHRLQISSGVTLGGTIPTYIRCHLKIILTEMNGVIVPSELKNLSRTVSY